MRVRVIGLAVTLSLSLFPAYSATPPKAGSVCSKQGLTKTYQGKKYTCFKSGKKLVWNKGVAIKTAAPTPTPTPTPTSTPTFAGNILDKCLANLSDSRLTKEIFLSIVGLTEDELLRAVANNSWYVTLAINSGEFGVNHAFSPDIYCGNSQNNFVKFLDSSAETKDYFFGGAGNDSVETAWYSEFFGGDGNDSVTNLLEKSIFYGGDGNDSVSNLASDSKFLQEASTVYSLRQKPMPSPSPTPSPTPTRPVDEVQRVIDDIREASLKLQFLNTNKFEFVFQSPTTSEVEEKTKRSLINAIPVFAKLGFSITDGLIIVAKDNTWLRDELIRNGCNVNFTFPDTTGFFVARSCQSGNGAIASKHWDALRFRDGLDGLYFNHTIPHEYFHQIQLQLTPRRNIDFPKWFYEGSAQFFTNQAWVSWNPQKSYVDWHTHWWTDLNPNYGPNACKSASILMMSDPSTPGVEGICAYSKGQLIVEFLVYKYGLEKYRDLYRKNNSPDWRNFNLVFKTVTNDELSDFYLQAEQFIISRGW